MEKSPADARYARPSQTSVAHRTFPANTGFKAYIRLLNSYDHPYDQETIFTKLQFSKESSQEMGS